MRYINLRFTLHYCYIGQQCWALCVGHWTVDGSASQLRLNMDKTELMWTGTEYNMLKIQVCCRSLTRDGVPVVT